MSDNLPETGELSPMKRALSEIRRLRAELEASRRPAHEPIAVLGCAVRLPGGVETPERFWQALVEGEDLIGSIPPERWESGLYWSADQQQPGSLFDLHGGFLKDVDAFDPDFFGISAREAESMDPQHRILLEVTWEALERSGIDPRTLRDTAAGVFLGLSNSDYSRMLTERPKSIDGYTGISSALSIAAGRIAYLLGTHGPAVVTETACSSSLVALHQAVQSLRAGETDLAIVGGINLMLTPEINIAFARSGMLSPTGRCRTFDASADGYVRSEGCGIVVLKRLGDAHRGGHRVLATVQGTAVNQDGRSAGITAPNGPAQESVLRAALADAGLSATAVRFVETHGTGTPLGDPIELRAIGAVYGGSNRLPLHVGAVKANLGHTEAAAGVISLIKAVEMLQPGRGVPPHPHLQTPTPHIDWKASGLEIPASFLPWGGTEDTGFIGVSSFGFSGTNAHAILGPGEPPPAFEAKDSAEDAMLCLSASDKEQMRTLAERYIPFLQKSALSLEEIAAAALTTRSRLQFRLVVRAATSAHAADLLDRWLAGERPAEVVTYSATTGDGDAAGADFGPVAQAFLSGKSGAAPEGGKAPRHVLLPTYPFRRRRFWLGGSALERRSRQRESVYAEVQRQAEQQSLQAPLGWKLDGFAEKHEVLVRLTRAHARNTLVRAGVFQQAGRVLSVAGVLQTAGFQPLYVHLVERWLEDLADAGVLARGEGGFSVAGPLTTVDVEPIWAEAALALEDDPGALAYLKNCSALLPDVLSGSKSALETLFPDGSFALAEGIYERSIEARYMNPIMATAARAAVSGLDARRTVRILEIGSGTGGTSASVLPAIASMDVEYWFTDLSDLFLERARRRFRRFDFMKFATFDLDRELGEQGLRPGMFDLVMAANVVHAAPSLPAALRHIREVLAPGGVLLLLETTKHQPWFDMSVGLIEGWQHFTDVERQRHPLLDGAEWSDVLARNGFRQVSVLPHAESPAAVLGQRVVLAQSAADGVVDSAANPEVRMKSVPSLVGEAASVPAGPSLVADLRDLSPEDRDRQIAVIARQTIHEVFRLDGDPEGLQDRDRLSDLGMDSLIALDLRAELSRRLGLEGRISSTVAFETGTVGELIRRLCDLASPVARTSSEEPESAKAPLLQHTAEEVAEMSDEEVEALLAERLNKA